MGPGRTINSDRRQPEAGSELAGEAAAAARASIQLAKSAAAKTKKINKIQKAKKIQKVKKKKKFEVHLAPGKKGGLSLKVEGRPKKFSGKTLKALAKKHPKEHAKGTRLKPGLSRNHILPYLTIAKEPRTLTRGLDLAGHAKFLQQNPHTFLDKTLAAKYAKLAKSKLKTAKDVAQAHRLRLQDRYNDPDNLYIGDSSANSSSGSIMKARQQQLSASYEAGSKLHTKSKKIKKLKSEFQEHSLDFPKGYAAHLRKQKEAAFKAAWMTRNAGKYL